MHLKLKMWNLLFIFVCIQSQNINLRLVDLCDKQISFFFLIKNPILSFINLKNKH